MTCAALTCAQISLHSRPKTQANTGISNHALPPFDRFPSFQRFPIRGGCLSGPIDILHRAGQAPANLAILEVWPPDAARWIDPPSTAVHIQRRLPTWIHHTPYHERYKFIPLSQISPDLQHAVIAAEDARFYQHHGFDWHEIQLAAEDDLEGDRTRGASTITQQLVKNLFFGTGRSILRKGAEFTLVPVAEIVLGKRRILEIYLNVVE